MFRLIVLISLCLFFECARAQDTSTAEYDEDATEAWPNDENGWRDREPVAMAGSVQRKWVSEIFDEVRDNFRMLADVSERCRNDFLMYETHLRNQTIWAVRMMESSEWPRLGLFSGVTTVLGDWSECLSVRSPTYRGQYCLVDGSYDYSFVEADPIQRGWDKPANQNSSVWGVIKMYDKILTRTSRRNLTWALCVPSSCSSDDLRTSVMNTASPIFQKYDMTFTANVAPNTCRVKESKPLPNTFLYTMCLVLFLGATVLLATYYDYRMHVLPKAGSKKPVEETNAAKVLCSFSLLRSWKCLTHSTPDTIHALYFAKSIMFVLIIIAHEGMLAIPFPKIEQEDTEMKYQPWDITFGFHTVVDVFIGISGYLTFTFGYEPTKKGGIPYFLGAIVFRWIRLIPVMGLYILVYVFMAPELADGPLWNRRMTYDLDCCRANWWTNMLAIQNLVNRKDLCLPQTWYIAVDFQLTILGTAILVILTKNFTLGIASMMLSSIVGVSLHFYEIYANQFIGLPTPAIYEMEVMRKQPFFSDLYIQAYSRVGPYMVGFAGALLTRVLMDRKYRPSITLGWLTMLLTIFVGIGSQLYGFLFAMLGRPYDAIENAAYGSITRTLVAVPVINAIVLVGLRRLGWFSYVLEWKIFLVMGRLAYVVYLSSFSIQFFRYSSMRQLIISTAYTDVAYGIMTDVCLTMMVATLLFAVAEGPLHNLTVLAQTIVYEKAKKSDTQHTNTAQQRYYDDELVEKCGSTNRRVSANPGV